MDWTSSKANEDDGGQEPKTKRRKGHDEEGVRDNCANADHKLDLAQVNLDQQDVQLMPFIQWCLSQPSPCVISPKIRMGKTGSCAGYGMVALEDISPGDQLFRIPLSKTLSWDNVPALAARASEMEKLAQKSRWAPTILAILLQDLMRENQSPWYHYLAIFLHSSQLDLPLFWNAEDQEVLLKGTGLAARIKKDRLQMEKDFTQLIFPLLQRLVGVPDSDRESLLERALKVSGFVMAYSFTRPEVTQVDEEDSVKSEENLISDEEEELAKALAEVPLMVPVADMLNASINKNNAKMVWGASPEEPLVMTAVKPIHPGEEIFNTYGEISNEEMLYLYGYAEDDTENAFEEVFVPCSLVYNALTQLVDQNEFINLTTCAQLDSRWEFLEKQKVVGEDMPLVVGRWEILTDFELEKILRTLGASEERFVEMCSLDEEEEEEEEEMVDNGSNRFTLGKLPELDPLTKKIMARVIQARMSLYPRSLDEEIFTVSACQTKLLEPNMKDTSLARDLQRQFYSSCVRKVQLTLLTEYLRVLTC